MGYRGEHLGAFGSARPKRRFRVVLRGQSMANGILARAVCRFAFSGLRLNEQRARNIAIGNETKADVFDYIGHSISSTYLKPKPSHNRKRERFWTLLSARLIALEHALSDRKRSRARISHGRLTLHPRNRLGPNRNSRAAPEGVFCAVRDEPDAVPDGVSRGRVDLRSERTRHPNGLHQLLDC